MSEHGQQPTEEAATGLSPTEILGTGDLGGTGARLLLSVVAVWAVSVLAYLIHISILPAIAFLAAAVLFLKVGDRVVDRFIAIMLAAATYVVLVAWVSPMVPALIHPITLVGILGTVPAIAWSLRRTSRPSWALADGISIGAGVVGAILWFLPMGGINRARMIDVLFFGPDNGPHLGMFTQVWRVHGYEFLTDRIGANAPDFAAYPQAIHAAFVAFGSVLTSSFDLPTAVPVELFAVFSCLLAGLLTLVLAWSVDKLIRGIAAKFRIRAAVGQVVPPVMLIIGPAAWILMSSISYTAAAITLITGFTYCATATKQPRLSTLLVTLSIIGLCAAYPLLGVFAPLIWITLLLSIKSFTLRHTSAYVLTTLVAIALSAPMFIMLVIRDVNHNVDTEGVFEPIPIALYVASAFALASILVLGTRAIPKPVLRFSWPTGIATVIFSIGAIVQWHRLGIVPYYSVKSMYATFLLTVVALATVVIVFSTNWQPRVSDARGRSSNLLTWGFSVVLIVTSSAAGILLSTAGGSRLGLSYNIVPGYNWITGDSRSHVGDTLILASQTSGTNRVPVLVPCQPTSTNMRWLTVMTQGRISKESFDLFTASCALDPFVSYVQSHPNLLIDAYVDDKEVRDLLLAKKKELKLTNLRVIEMATS